MLRILKKLELSLPLIISRLGLNKTGVFNLLGSIGVIDTVD